MKRFPLRVVLLVALALAPAWGGEPDEPLGAAFDQPGRAAAAYRAKRVPVGARGELPVERYVVALSAMRAMPQYSTGLGKALPSRAAMFSGQLEGAVEAAALGAWTWLGPGNVGGRTRALVIDPRAPAVMYAAGASGGVWKSVDGGRHWAPLTDLMANLAVSSLALDPKNSAILYAGTGEGYANLDAQRGAGIFRSTDAGRSWARIPGTGVDDFAYVNRLAVSGKTGRVYAATRSGVLRGALSGGRWSWTRTLVPTDRPGGCADLALRPDRPDDVLLASCGLAGQGTIFRNLKAQTGAAGWSIVLDDPGMGRTSLALAPSNPDVVYALASYAGPATDTRAMDTLHAVYRSARGGEAGSWTVQAAGRTADPLSASLLSYTVLTFFKDCGRGDRNISQGLGWYANTIAVDPADPDRVWAGGVDLFRSDDAGRTWGLASYWWAYSFLGVLQPPPVPASYLHADNHVLAFDPRYDGRRVKTLFAGNDGGVFRTLDARAPVARGARAACDPHNSAVAWQAMNHGYGVTQFYHGAPFPDGGSYAGGAQDNGTVLGRDATGPDGWQTIWGSDGGDVLVDPVHPNVLYAASTGASLKKSTDGGKSFAPAANGLRGLFLFTTPFALDPGHPSRLWTGSEQLWRSDDGAASWSPASPRLLDGPTPAPAAQVSALAVAAADSNRVLAGTNEGSIFRSAAATTATADTAWAKAKPRAGWVSSVAFDPANPAVAYATYSSFGGVHVWKSADGGASWAPLDGTGAASRRLPDLPVHAIAVDPTRPGRLYVGTDLGVFASLDGGASWSVEATGFANVVVEALAIQRGAGGSANLFAFTYGRGAYRVALR